MRLVKAKKSASLAWAAVKTLVGGNDDLPTSLDGAGAERVSDAARAAAGQIRALEAVPPALMIYGVMPRSGTVYLGELLRLHPDVHPYPNQLWEVPFLRCIDDLLAFQQHFLADYRANIGKLGERDFLPLFGSAFMRYLAAFTPPGKTMLLKEPDVRYLEYFPVAFPHEHLLLLLRDGRDVVHSTMRTWPSSDFEEACRRWSRSARVMLAFARTEAARRADYWLVRFEDLLEDREAFLAEACRRYGLDPARYPYHRLDEVRAMGSSSLAREGGVVWHDNPVPPKGFKPVGHWREWSPARKRAFKRLAGAALIEAGYAEDMAW